MNVVIRCDASESIGGGHAMRCLALGQEVRRRGGAVVLAMASGAGMLGDRPAQAGIAVQAVSAGDSDLRATLELTRDADWLLVDGAALVDALAVDLARERRVLVLDDRGFAAPAGGGFQVLNTNVWASADDYPGFAPDDLLLGLRYALLRPEFVAAGSREPQAPPRLLVLSGASDPTGFALRLLDSLAGRLPAQTSVDVVVGPMNSRRAALEAVSHRMPQVRLHVDPANMAALMRQADLAVSAAGGTLWELYALGIPAIAVVIADNQRRNAAWLTAHGFRAVVADDADAAVGQVVELAGDAAARRALATRGRELVDGRGAARVVDFLKAASGGCKRKAAV